MRMLEGRTGSFAMVLENENVAEPLVVLQIQHAVAISPQNIFDGARRQAGQRGHVVRRFHDYFVRADAIHFVEKSFAFAIQIAFNSKRRKTVGDDTNVPARSIAAAVAPIDQNFRRRLAFGAGAEGAILWAGDQDAFAEKIRWAFPAISGNDDPAARD